MSERQWRVVFETASPFRYPHAYDGRDRACLPVESIPEDWWHEVVADRGADEAAARDQVEGLHELMAEGEYVRNVRLESRPAGSWEEAR